MSQYPSLNSLSYLFNPSLPSFRAIDPNTPTKLPPIPAEILRIPQINLQKPIQIPDFILAKSNPNTTNAALSSNLQNPRTKPKLCIDTSIPTLPLPSHIQSAEYQRLKEILSRPMMNKPKKRRKKRKKGKKRKKRKKVKQKYKSPIKIAAEFTEIDAILHSDTVSLQKKKKDLSQIRQMLDNGKKVQLQLKPSENNTLKPSKNRVQNISYEMTQQIWDQTMANFDHTKHGIKLSKDKNHKNSNTNTKSDKNAFLKHKLNDLSNYTFLKNEFPSLKCMDCDSALQCIPLAFVGEGFIAEYKVNIYKICAICSGYPKCQFPLYRETYAKYWIRSAAFDDRVKIKRVKRKRKRETESERMRAVKKQKKKVSVSPRRCNSYKDLQNLCNFSSENWSEGSKSQSVSAMSSQSSQKSSSNKNIRLG